MVVVVEIWDTVVDGGGALNKGWNTEVGTLVQVASILGGNKKMQATIEISISQRATLDVHANPSFFTCFVGWC